jgi:putative transposase
MKKEVTYLSGTGFRFGSYCIYKRKRVTAFIIDETAIQIGSQHFRLWICIESIHSSVLGIHISEKRNMFVAEKFIRSLVSNYGKTCCIY